MDEKSDRSNESDEISTIKSIETSTVQSEIPVNQEENIDTDAK